MKKVIIGIIIVVGILILGPIFLKDKGTSENVVSSSDGHLELIIPDSALPSNVSRSDIVITDATQEVVSSDPKAGELIKKVYKLEPAGIKFSEPIDLNLSFTKEEGQALPIVIHQSEYSLEVLSDAGYQVAGNKVTLSTKMDHFSVVTRIGVPFEFNFYGGGEYGLGESFTFDIVIKPKVGDKVADLAIYYTEDDKGYMALAKIERFDGWEVMPFKITATPGLTPTEVTSPGDKSEGYEEVVLITNYTCSKEGDHNISIPEGIPIKFIVSWDKELPFLKDKQVQEGTNDYLKYWKYAVQATHWVDHRYHWEKLKIGCWEHKHDMIHIGPPYFIDCGGGKILSGMSQGDARTGEQIIDADGNPIDFETGKPVKCE